MQQITTPKDGALENPASAASSDFKSRWQRIDGRLGRFFEGDQKNAIPVLDGVRAVACLLVVVYHLNWTSYHQQLWNPRLVPFLGAILLVGGSGVTLFFVLSGFLLFLPFARGLLFPDGSWPSARRFYLRRALRILPGYYVALSILVIFWQPQYLRPEHWRDLLLFVTFFMDSTPETYRQINGPFWTLAVEWQFYLILPLLALGFFWLLRKVPENWRLRAVIGCLVGQIGWALVMRAWGSYYVSHPAESLLVPRPVLNVLLFCFYGMTGKFMEDFGIGMLIATCYVYVQRGPRGGELGAWLRRRSLWLLVGGLGWLYVLALWHLNHDVPILGGLGFLDQPYNLLIELGFALGYGACVAGLLFGSAAMRRPIEWRYLRWIGMISYSMYIWHLVLIALFDQFSRAYLRGLNPGFVYLLFWLLVPFVIIPVSTLSFGLVERPWMKLGGRLDRKRVAVEKKFVKQR